MLSSTHSAVSSPISPHSQPQPHCRRSSTYPHRYQHRIVPWRAGSIRMPARWTDLSDFGSLPLSLSHCLSALSSSITTGCSSLPLATPTRSYSKLPLSFHLNPSVPPIREPLS